MNTSPTSPQHTLCPECHAPYRQVTLRPGEFVTCGRCEALLQRYFPPQGPQRLWAITTTALFFFVMVNISPIILFDIAGNTQSNLIITGIIQLTAQGYGPIAILVLFTAIIIPAAHLLSLWYLLAGVNLNQPLPGIRQALEMSKALGDWNLIPVYGVAAMAAVFKLDQLGSVHWKIGALWLFLLSLCVLIITRKFHPDLVQPAFEQWQQRGKNISLSEEG